MDYGGPQRQPAVPHPHDPGVILGTIDDLGHIGDAAVSLCRLGCQQIPASTLAPDRHVEFWLIDHEEPARNPHLDFVLRDIARTIAELRADGHTVLVHCVAAEQRAPSAALAYSRWLDVPEHTARAVIRAVRPSARGDGWLWERASSVGARST